MFTGQGREDVDHRGGHKDQECGVIPAAAAVEHVR